MLFDNTNCVIEQSSRRITSFCLTRGKNLLFQGQTEIFPEKKKGVSIHLAAAAAAAAESGVSQLDES